MYLRNLTTSEPDNAKSASTSHYSNHIFERTSSHNFIAHVHKFSIRKFKYLKDAN